MDREHSLTDRKPAYPGFTLSALWAQGGRQSSSGTCALGGYGGIQSLAAHLRRQCSRCGHHRSQRVSQLGRKQKPGMDIHRRLGNSDTHASRRKGHLLRTGLIPIIHILMENGITTIHILGIPTDYSVYYSSIGGLEIEYELTRVLPR